MKCLELFGVLERYAAEVGDEDMIHGPDTESDDELSPDASWSARAWIWLWQRSRGICRSGIGGRRWCGIWRRCGAVCGLRRRDTPAMVI